MSKIFAFLTGAAIGAAVTFAYYRTVHDRALDEVAAENNKNNIPKDYRANVSSVDTHLRRISDNEFGEEDDYETGTLFYYKNGILTDGNNEPIDIYDNVIGFFTDFMSHEEENIYVRDDKLKIDYEVLMVDEAFEDDEGTVAT